MGQELEENHAGTLEEELPGAACRAEPGGERRPWSLEHPSWFPGDQAVTRASTQTQEGQHQRCRQAGQ